MLRLTFLFGLFLSWASPGMAQSTSRIQALIVAVCGTAPNSGYTVGTLQFVTMDPNGQLCPGTGGGGGGSVTQGTTPWVVQSQTPYPVGATAITASATGSTTATTATLAGTSGKTTYICSYSVRANATAAATVTDTVTGVITATMSSLLWVAPLASGLGVDEQIFTPCVPASGANVGIAIVSGAPGSGGTVSVHATGYQQ